MAKQTQGLAPAREPTKQELERQMQRTRESLAESYCSAFARFAINPDVPAALFDDCSKPSRRRDEILNNFKATILLRFEADLNTRVR